MKAKKQQVFTQFDVHRWIVHLPTNRFSYYVDKMYTKVNQIVERTHLSIEDAMDKVVEGSHETAD